MKIFFVFILFFMTSFKVNAADVPAIHGMLMVGNQTVYISHLPMFHGPHDYQIIMEVTLSSQGANPQSVYVNDRMRTRERLYTLVPDEPFVLPEVVMQKKSFSATIFRGHFERGGTPIFKGAKVNIQRVVYFHKFNPTDHRLDNLEYLLFGKGSELFLAHLIVACPDYDQVLAVATAHPIPPNRLLSPVLIKFDGRANTLPLKEGEVAQGQISANGNTETFKALGQFYFETGDLVCMTH